MSWFVSFVSVTKWDYQGGLGAFEILDTLISRIDISNHQISPPGYFRALQQRKKSRKRKIWRYQLWWTACGRSFDVLGPGAAIAFVKAGAFMCSGLMYRGLTCVVLRCGVVCMGFGCQRF